MFIQTDRHTGGRTYVRAYKPYRCEYVLTNMYCKTDLQTCMRVEYVTKVREMHTDEGHTNIYKYTLTGGDRQTAFQTHVLSCR